MSAILREISVKTSYQMIRLVFRPYTQIRRTILHVSIATGLQQSFLCLHPVQA